jgi:molybdopterin-guanine dinucleotide biosynthesis protein MobB
MNDADHKQPHVAQSRRSWRFHPYEIAVCGYKNSGKTTLLEGLAKCLGSQQGSHVNALRLAYLKHDAHHFTMDHPGKDTDRLRNAGVETALIMGSNGFAQLGNQCDSGPMAPYALLAADALLVEGYKASGLPRIMVLDKDLAILDDPAWLEAPPVAVVYPFPPNEADEIKARALVQYRLGELPWFGRNDIAAIAEFVRKLWDDRRPPLRGLVLTGGLSTRMGRDKALVDYHGCTQLEYSVRLLSRYCSEVVVSCRPDQRGESVRGGYPTLVDRFLDMGPTGGILSALASDETGGQAWLVLACDLPRVDGEVLGRLLAARNPFRFATAFRGTDGFPEPLCAIWEPKSYPRLLQFVGMGHTCPRKCLINSPVTLIDPPSPVVLENGNDPQDFRRIQDDLHLGS